MIGRRAIALAVVAVLASACGGGGPASVAPSATSTPIPYATLTPTPQPTGTVQARQAFQAKVVADGGGRIRMGPGTDNAVVGLVAKGQVVVFDGWYRHADDVPQLDATSERYEAWSRDWYHLADGRGWMHAITVDTRPPAGMPQTDPNQIPIVIG